MLGHEALDSYLPSLRHFARPNKVLGNDANSGVTGDPKILRQSGSETN